MPGKACPGPSSGAGRRSDEGAVARPGVCNETGRNSEPGANPAETLATHNSTHLRDTTLAPKSGKRPAFSKGTRRGRAPLFASRCRAGCSSGGKPVGRRHSGHQLPTTYSTGSTWEAGCFSLSSRSFASTRSARAMWALRSSFSGSSLLRSRQLSSACWIFPWL